MTSRKSVLITGCTPGGIGAALAVQFHNRGCHVIATARRLEVLEELRALGMDAVKLDVTSKESIEECKSQVEKLTGGRLDILINNAGRTHTIPATDADIDEVRATYETNVFGPMQMCRSFISLLVPARGLIINVSSCSSLVPYLFGAIYSSTKGALNVYSRALRMEVAPLGVRVMILMAGTVCSNITNHADYELPEDSLYKPVDDLFQKRKGFSQSNRTMSTTTFASKVVVEALKGEGWLGGWIGRTPDWYYLGGVSTLAWIASCLPAWMGEGAVNIFFGMGKIAQRLQAARAKQD